MRSFQQQRRNSVLVTPILKGSDPVACPHHGSLWRSTPLGDASRSCIVFSSPLRAWARETCLDVASPAASIQMSRRVMTLLP